MEAVPGGLTTMTGIDIRLIIHDNGRKHKYCINLKRRARRNGYSLPKQILVDVVKKKIREDGILRRSYSDAVLDISMSCGGSASYRDWDDIPDESVPCSCGDPNHWLIRYRLD